MLLSPNLDTEDPAGKFTAHVLAAAAEYERDLIGARTREGMAQRRAEGVHVGRPRSLPLHVVERIVLDRANGSTLKQIAVRLTEEGVLTAPADRDGRSPLCKGFWPQPLVNDSQDDKPEPPCPSSAARRTAPADQC